MRSGRAPDKKLIALHDVLLMKTNKVCKRFSALPKEFECSKEEKHELHISRVGLETTLEVRCTYRLEHCKVHSWLSPLLQNPMSIPDTTKHMIKKLSNLGGPPGWDGLDTCKNLFLNH